MSILNVSERLRRVESVTLTAGGRTEVEAELVCAVDRASDDLRVAQAQAALLGHDAMAQRLQRCHRILAREDEESGARASFNPRGDRGTILKRTISQLHDARRLCSGQTEWAVHRMIVSALGELEKLE